MWPPYGHHLLLSLAPCLLRCLDALAYQSLDTIFAVDLPLDDSLHIALIY